jgi:Homeodomain-like domain
VCIGLMLNPRERAQLAEAASAERRVRNWRRMRAIELLAEGRRPEAVAAALGCARSSVYAWAKAWREMGPSGLGARAGSIDISFNLISVGDLQGTPLVEMPLEDFERTSQNAPDC